MGRVNEDLPSIPQPPRIPPRRFDVNLSHDPYASYATSSMSYHPGHGDFIKRPPDEGVTTPICRCRVIYLGSAVPHVTKDGLQGIQEPLRDLYPDQGLLLSQSPESIGIDSWLSVWSNGILIENVDENGREVKRFFPIDSLHYCAAVRYVVIPSHVTCNATTSPPSATTNNALGPVGDSSKSNDGMSGSSDLGKKINGVLSSSSNTQTSEFESSKIKFLPLDSPFSRNSNITIHPPLFACILRRTTGIKVLECHAFICKRDQAANALVRCCFHAYADSMHARQMEQDFADSQSNLGFQTNDSSSRRNSKSGMGVNGRRFSRSISDLDTVENKIEAWRQRSTEALNMEEIEVVQSTASGAHHDPDIDNDDGEDDQESSSISRQHRRLSHQIPRDDQEEDDNYKIWPGGPGVGMMYSTSTPHLPHLHQQRQLVASPLVRTPHHLHPVPFLPSGHDGRATLRSIRTTASSAAHHSHLPHPHHPHFQPPSLSSRSMVNLAGPHPPPSLPPLFHPFAGGPPPPPPHLPPLPGHPHHLSPPPFFPVPTTLSKKELKSLKSSMKKLKKKNKGQDFILPLPPLPPPPFLRGPLPPPPPFLVPGPRGAHIHHFPPPPLLCPVDDSLYSPAIRPQTPVSHLANGYPHEEPPPLNVYATTRRDFGHSEAKGSSRRSSSHSQSRHHDSNSEDPSDSDHLNTGIYRKKANLNERAFSYSIRQECRSRSGSAANVHYPGNDSNSGIISNGGRVSPPLQSGVTRSNGRMNGHHEEIIAQSLENLNISNGRKNHHNHLKQHQRNGKSSTSSHSSSQSNHIQHQALLHSNHEEGNLYHQNNFKTASIKRGSGHHLQNGSSGSKITPVPMPPPPPMIVSNGRLVLNKK